MFPLMYIIAKFIHRDPYKKASEMDFVTNIKEIEAATWVFLEFVGSAY